MEFHHIGVATSDINKSIKIYKMLDFTPGEIIFDDVQQVNICFVKKSGHPDIELIEPVNDTSPVSQILKKVGTGPYHLCYCTDDLSKELIKLKEKKFLVITGPVAAIAFDRKRICFCYNKDLGLIELVEN